VEPSNRQKKSDEDGAQSAGHRHAFHIRAMDDTHPTKHVTMLLMLRCRNNGLGVLENAS
jgi:hypothetical protein